MADLLNMIPQSTDPTTVITGQNKGNVALARAEQNNLDQVSQEKQQILDRKAAMTSEEAQVNKVFGAFVSNTTEKIRSEVSGTQQVINLQQRAFDDVYAQLAETTREAEGYSFFTNPIATIRNKVKQSALTDQLSDIVTSINAGTAHIDRAYSEGAQELRDFRATATNLSMADLQAKQNELTLEAQRLGIEQETRVGKLAAADKALNRQRGIQGQGGDETDKAYVNSLLFRTKYRIANNGTDLGYDAAQAKLQAQSFAASSPEEQKAWTDVAVRLSTMPPLERRDGETDKQFADRNLSRDIAVVSSTVGAGAADLMAKAGTTAFNDLFGFADAATKQTVFAPVMEAKNNRGGALDPAETKTRQAAAMQQYQSATTGDKLTFAQQAIEQDLTQRAANSSNPPLTFLGADSVMATTNVDANVVEFFKSDAAKQAIELPVRKTFKMNSDVALNLFDAMEGLTTTSGKELKDNEKAEVVAKYMKQMYLGDYSLSSDNGKAMDQLFALKPGLSMRFQIPVSFDGKDKKYNLADPNDILNLRVAIEKKATTERQQQAIRESAMQSRPFSSAR